MSYKERLTKLSESAKLIYAQPEGSGQLGVEIKFNGKIYAGIIPLSRKI